ncbi:DNA-processing protein DprA [Acidiphilium iwatense]|uniref:DNA-processing protein DprA n=1 Tax=Acidiphilium iwatense TaxID=768198 RepID=A0ABS9E1R1_9PROT|nr:DNA-processing protein DprA [Acidiphilium iwatense]MCF3948288.1 DNA-processing protein DprA [Acidiphilium iwatense]
MTDRLAQLRLIRTEGVGPQTYRRLLARFATPEEALQAIPALARAGGRAKPPAIPSAGDARRELDRHARLGARLIFLNDADYPPLLALLPDAPPMIAVKGDPLLLHKPIVAVVGARNASANGRRIAEDIAAELAASGRPIVSGLARGIDGAAHEAALRAGATIAAIPGGMDVVYPPEHKDLQARIAERGAVVAEAPPGTAPLARHFPKRNRIIAGLALGVVVIEAALRSGSLLTARYALDYGRELFAVPGSPLDPRARGGNDLIRQGAHLTETAADVLLNVPDQPGALFAGARITPAPPGFAEPPRPANDPEPQELRLARRQVPDLLCAAPLPVDEIARHCQFSASVLAAVLTELELAGRIETLPGNKVGLLLAP